MNTATEQLPTMLPKNLSSSYKEVFSLYRKETDDGR